MGSRAVFSIALKNIGHMYVGGGIWPSAIVLILQRVQALGEPGV